MSMRNLAKEISDYLAGPPTITQQQFGRKIGMTDSKLSRIRLGRFNCDRDDLDLILGGIRDDKARRRIVAAYIRDVCSPLALLHVQEEGGAYTKLDFKVLSKKGESALRALLSSPMVGQIEKMFIAMCDTLGLKY